MTEAFCGCVDSHCPCLDLDAADMLMCGACKLDDEVAVDVEVDVDGGSSMFEFVCGIDDEEDDEFVTADYESLRDVDGWQRRDPWGSSSESRPKHVVIASTPITTVQAFCKTYHIVGEYSIYL